MDKTTTELLLIILEDLASDGDRLTRAERAAVNAAAAALREVAEDE